MNSPKVNFIYNLIYQILALIIPLITAPYLSRIIGVEGVGIYSYTYSIVYYFMLLTLLGVNNYGNREISKVRENKEKCSKTFCSIYSLQIIMGIVAIALYIVYLMFFCGKYKLYAVIEILFLISATLDINWFFFGMEEFKKTITRNIIIKISNVILIFIFIKNESDLWKYTLIMSGMTCLSQMILFGFLKNKIKLVKINIKDVLKHIKPNLILFIPVIAVSLYKIMDKIMLGFLSDVTEVGFYENAEKIVNIPLTLITALGTVMLPRISNIISKGENNKVAEYISKSITFVMFMSFAMCSGLISVGYNFAPLYFGIEFQKTGMLITLLAVTLPFLSFANVLRTQYLIPKEKDKVYIISVSLGAITNLIMNFIFIPNFASIGACFGTIVAEFIVVFYQAYAVKKELPIKKYLKNICPFFFKSLVMLICVYSFNFIQINGALRVVFQILIGCSVYGIINLKYILSLIDIKKYLKKFKKKEGVV